MKIAVLATGSNGNACYVETNKHKFLIDCGISFKSLVGRMDQFGLSVSSIDSLLLTHEHYDHVSGLKVLAKKIPLTIYTSQGTYDGLNLETKSVLASQNVSIVKAEEVIGLEDCKITVLRLHHDSKEPIGFVFEEFDKKFVYITDTGFVDQIYYPLISNADGYVMESNYDVELLWSSKRPFELKRRIDGDYGHMSNEASAVMMSKLIGPKTKKIVYAHISDDCNYYHMPEFIKNAHKKVYSECGVDYSNIDLYCGNRKGVTGVFEL
mgnify:CR=1 FL=1